MAPAPGFWAIGTQENILARPSKKTSRKADDRSGVARGQNRGAGGGTPTSGNGRNRKNAKARASDLANQHRPDQQDHIGRVDHRSLPSLDEYAEHLQDEPAARSPRASRQRARARFKERLADWRARFEDFLERVHKRGRERLTIMVIPHTEQRILNLHVSIYAISGTIATVVIVLVVSMISLVGKSGEDIQFYDMGLTNSQFNMQSVKMAEEMMPLHERVTEYASTIAELYVKLDGDESVVLGQGGVAQGVIDSEVADLKQLVDECRGLGDDCDQQLTEEILRKVIYLSRQDNHNLKKAVEISDKILAELGTREKQSLLRNTPSIWPTRGYLLSPYGRVADPLRGRERFQRGIQIGAVQGTEVYATAPGEVTEVTYDDSYGLQIRVRHRYGLATFYAHLDRSRVKKGDEVAKGQVIGYVGKSGRAPVSMLYYEVHVGTVAYNPHAFLNHLQDIWLIQPRT